METMRKIFNSKKGFTLIEMVITTLVLSILMGITMGMITSSGRVFSSTSELAIDKMVGDGVFESLESMAKYATHIEIANPGTAQPDSECTQNYNQGFYINVSDEENKSGTLRYQAKSQEATRYPAVPFSNSFYQGRTIKYVVEPYEYPLAEGEQVARRSNKHLTITVIVNRNGEEVFKRSNTIRCVNLGLLGAGDSSNVIVSSYTVKENQYINFTCGEQLVLAEVDGYEVFSNATTVMNQYNAINNVLAAELNETINSDLDENAKKAAMTLASTKAKEEISDLFGGFNPSKTTYAEGDPRHYFNGVQASREEVFYGLMKKNYQIDGKLEAESYQGFSNPETFFNHSTFSEYGGNMVQLALFIMNDGASYSSELNTFNPSQINDYNIYSVRWNDWFVNEVTSGILWWKKTSYNVIDLSLPDNSLGKNIGGKKSYNNAYTVFHPYRNTWYYQPDKSTALSVWWNKVWDIDDKPIRYDISKKSSAAVMMDIDSNIVGSYREIWIGFGEWRYKITEINTTSGTLWNSLPTREIGLP